MLRRIEAPRTTLAAFGFAALPAVAMAQAATAQPIVPHASVYTARSTAELLAAAKPPRTNMPLLSPKQMPMAVLQSHNIMPSGAFALLPGLSTGSSDGVHRDPNPLERTVPEAYGNASPQAIAPYTTARASATVLGPTPAAASVAVTSYPWRATGKLMFNNGTDAFVCSASLIAPGLVVTAAHCVFEYGANSTAGYHTNYAFIPAQNTPGGTPPFGVWTALAEIIAPTYYNGTDTCLTRGINCNNDIAIMVMAPNASGQLPGALVGFYGYAWNGYSFVPSFGSASLASITQLGYPVAFDSGLMMERTDGIGSYWSPDGILKQTLLGTAMTAGSSGGPWLVNFGATPTVNAAASLGNTAVSQVVMGVTSWGLNAVGSNTQGASWFGQNLEFPSASYPDTYGINRGGGNIGALIAAACSISITSC